MKEEIFMIAKAKGVHEEQIWKMGQMEYYNTIKVLENYNKKISKTD